MAKAELPEILTGLEPSAVWQYFHDISQIPRCSGHEEGVRSYIVEWARERNIVHEVDEVGNVLLRVRSDAKGPTVCLQGHMDMVCVADDDSQHDFSTDPITLRREDDNIFATGTTLGADNGIGLAFSLALAEEDTGPLEILCTVDEEVGLLGASAIKPEWLKSSYLLNLDSEEEDCVTVACSGGRDLVLRSPCQRGDDKAQGVLVDIKVAGLEGGHSGVDIALGRTNAIKILAETLKRCHAKGARLIDINGGVKRNAIPPTATARILVDEKLNSELPALFETVVKDYVSAADPALHLKATAVDAEIKAPLTGDDCARILHLLESLPHGVQKTTASDPRQPYVSINLALVSVMDDGKLEVILTGRSPSSDELDGLEKLVEGVGSEHSMTYSCENGYPGWEPNYDSPLLATTIETYKKVFDREPEVLEIHAGLECGIIGSKYPDMHMISIGPDLKFPHSPREHVSISSVTRVYNLCQQLIAKLQS